MSFSNITFAFSINKYTITKDQPQGQFVKHFRIRRVENGMTPLREIWVYMTLSCLQHAHFII